MQQNFAESQNQQGKTDSILEKVDRMQEQLEHVHEALTEITSVCRQQQQQKTPPDQPAVSKLASKHILFLQTHGCAEGGGEVKSCALNCNVDGDYLILYSHYHMTPLHPPLFVIFWSSNDS